MKELLLKQSLAVRTFVLPEVEEKIKKISPTYDTVKEYNTSIVDWLKPVIDLSDFYVYPMNGITEGLNWFVGTSDYNISKTQGEYQWIDNITTRKNPYIQYQSVPSAVDGNYKPVAEGDSVALDLAYVGSTQIQKINIHKNVNHVFYSLSKSFGVSNIRTGWYFTRQPDAKLDSLIYQAKYYNYFSNSISEEIINNFDIDYVHSKLHKQQLDVCEKLDFVPSDNVWLATTTKEEYLKFRRVKNIARICLSGVYTKC